MTKDQLQNYFYDLCSKEQALEVERWLAALKEGSSDDALLKELMKQIKIDRNEPLVDSAFEKFVGNILLHNRRKSGEHSFMARLGRFYRVSAAVLLLPLLAATIYFYIEKNNPKEWIEKYVPYGQSKMICLPDSSKMWLNAGTKLIYPKKFNNSIRQVYLAGEAYVEVTKDENRPFVLSAGEVSVEVLGTKFNIKSYSEDSHIAVSLLEGAIKINANYHETWKTSFLKPGEIVKFTKTTGELNKSELVMLNRKQWHNGKGFYFIDESLSEIVATLERYFNVRITIENELLKEDRFYAIFVNNENLEEILSALNANGKMKIKYNPRVIYIY